MARKKKVSAKKNVSKVVTPVFRAAFANVFHPRETENEDGTTGKAKYSVTMLFDADEDLSKLERLAMRAIKEKWGDKPPKSLRMPFRDGSEKEDLEGFSDEVVFATASSFYRPGIVERNDDGELIPIVDPEDFYSGCYARATVTAYTYDKRGNRGVAFGLHNLLKVKDGERLGGRTSPEEDFEDIEDDDDLFD